MCCAFPDSCRLQVLRSASGLWRQRYSSVTWDISSAQEQCSASGLSDVTFGGWLHLIMGNPLGLRDELSTAHFAVAVCEKPLIHFCWLHLEKETNTDEMRQRGEQEGGKTGTALWSCACKVSEKARNSTHFIKQNNHFNINFLVAMLPINISLLGAFSDRC